MRGDVSLKGLINEILFYLLRRACAQQREDYAPAREVVCTLNSRVARRATGYIVMTMRACYHCLKS